MRVKVKITVKRPDAVAEDSHIRSFDCELLLTLTSGFALRMGGGAAETDREGNRENHHTEAEAEAEAERGRGRGRDRGRERNEMRSGFRSSRKFRFTRTLDFNPHRSKSMTKVTF